MISLKVIDLSKCFDCDHPDIKDDHTQYLAKISGVWRTGRFNRQWYGLNFHVGSHSIQLDDARYPHKPPTWTELYEISDVPETEPDTRNLRKVRIK